MNQTPLSIPVNLLDFDPENPRFFDVTRSPYSQPETIDRMVKKENIEELVGSIGQQNFFSGEPLLVAHNPKSPDRYIVVEGNRRLAALKILTGEVSNPSPTLADLAKSSKYKPTEVPCFVFPKRKDILRYLGFRHISGAKRWEPLAKARYLASLVTNFYSDRSLDEQMRAVARDIGSRRDYVAQQLTALNLYDHAKRSDEFYGLQRVDEEDVSFSFITTALSYSGIVEFLEIPGRASVTLGELNDRHAKELFSWMFAQDQNGETVLGESRQLKKLAAVVSSPEALIRLRSSGKLDEAYEFTSEPGDIFLSKMKQAEAAIADCIGMLNNIPHVDNSHLNQVDRISDSAEDLRSAINRRIRRSQRDTGRSEV